MSGKTKDEDNFKQSLDHLTEKLYSKQLAYKTRDFLRRVRKPKEVDVETFHLQLVTIKNFLAYMPEFKQKGLNKPMSEEELSLIFQYAMPVEWQGALVKTGREMDMEPKEIIEYMKTMEDFKKDSKFNEERMGLLLVLQMEEATHQDLLRTISLTEERITEVQVILRTIGEVEEKRNLLFVTSVKALIMLMNAPKRKFTIPGARPRKLIKRKRNPMIMKK